MLANFDSKNVSNETFEKLEKYTSSPDWNLEEVKKVSLPCFHIMQWISCIQSINKK